MVLGCPCEKDPLEVLVACATALWGTVPPGHRLLSEPRAPALSPLPSLTPCPWHQQTSLSLRPIWALAFAAASPSRPRWPGSLQPPTPTPAASLRPGEGSSLLLPHVLGHHRCGTGSTQSLSFPSALLGASSCPLGAGFLLSSKASSGLRIRIRLHPLRLVSGAQASGACPAGPPAGGSRSAPWPAPWGWWSPRRRCPGVQRSAREKGLPLDWCVQGYRWALRLLAHSREASSQGLKASSADVSPSPAPGSGGYWVAASPCSRPTDKSSGTALRTLGQRRPLLRNPSPGVLPKRPQRQSLSRLPRQGQAGPRVQQPPAVWLSRFPVLGQPAWSPRPLWEGLGVIPVPARRGAAASFPLGTRRHVPGPRFHRRGPAQGRRTWARDRDLFPGAAALGLLPSVLALFSVRFRLYVGRLPVRRAPGKPCCTDHLPRSVGQASWSAAAVVTGPGFWPLSGAPRPLSAAVPGRRGRAGGRPFSPPSHPGLARPACVVR
ncbi:uncharacterized protein [Kogia breviceps]|uniref:uncharacterized protein n=1 Tax=Kogia breviceps TaxID=27615 RepID=UPI0034D32C2C